MSDNDELRAARQLRQAVERLAHEVRPERDLWPEIASRLEARPRREPAAGWWRLAAAMILVAGGLATAQWLRPATTPPVSPVADLSAGATAMAATHLRQRDGVVHAHNDLVGVVARQQGRLDESGAAALAAGMADLERAAADIEAALAAHPNDRRLRLALAAAYRREAHWTSRFGRV